jgi:DHA2 family multidrug resistance protein
MAANDLFYLSALLFLGLVGLVWLAQPRRSAAPADAGGAH